MRSSAERRLAPMKGVLRLPDPNRGRHAGPLMLRRGQGLNAMAASRRGAIWRLLFMSLSS